MNVLNLKSNNPAQNFEAVTCGVVIADPSSLQRG